MHPETFHTIARTEHEYWHRQTVRLMTVRRITALRARQVRNDTTSELIDAVTSIEH